MKKFKCIYKDKFKTDFILNEESFKCKDDKYRYLYKIIFPNGKYYIGKHTTKKLNDGYGGSGIFLPKEYANNNIENVEKIILKFLNSIDELNIEEEKIIGDLYLTDEKCLNYCKGGNGGITEIISRKISKSKKGKKRTKESIDKQRLKCIGKLHSKETKEKQSEWNKNFWNSDDGIERRKKMSELMKNREISDEFKKKLSILGKKRFENRDFKIKHLLISYYYEINKSIYCEYINELLKKKTFTDKEYFFLKELIEKFKNKRIEDKKISQAIDKKYKEKYSFTEEHRRKISEARKGCTISEEVKEKMSKQKCGRNNSNYCNDTIFMLDAITNEIIKEFYDCIDAIEYVKENINKKATTKEIFVACRKNKIRYNHKWRQNKKEKGINIL